MEKTQLKRLKQLSRSELLEVMLALKRENDILMMENLRLKTIKHKLERELHEITDTLGRIERGTYDADHQAESAQDGAWQDNAFESVYDSAEEYTAEQSFESVFDSYADEVTNR